MNYNIRQGWGQWMLLGEQGEQRTQLRGRGQEMSQCRETQKTMGREAAKGITVAQGNGSSRSGQQDGMWVPRGGAIYPHLFFISHHAPKFIY